MARLVRLAVAKLSGSHDPFGLGDDVSYPRMHHVRELQKDGKTMGHLYAAYVEAGVAFRDGVLGVDGVAIRQAEGLLDIGLRSVAVSRRQGVSFSSPIPYVGLDLSAEPGPVDDVIASEFPPVRQVVSSGHALPLHKPGVWERLRRRSVAVGLLSDAFSTTGALGRFALVMRFFEYALATSQRHLSRPLAAYASAAGRGFDETEVERWTAMRPGIVHPNLRALDSAELTPGLVLPRAEELALDVLVNKRDLPSDEAARDVLWEPPSGGAGATTADIFATQGQDFSAELYMTDAFGTYPMNFGAILPGTGLLERIHWLMAPSGGGGVPLIAQWSLGD